METVQPLERLQVLEKRIANIIDLLHAEKEKSVKLEALNKFLTERIEAMETSLLKETRSIDELAQERALTKTMVDELIQTIDQLVENMPEVEANR